MDTATQVGEVVRSLRQARGLSVRGLAAMVDFSPSFISQLENGQVSPSISSLTRIATALGVSLVELFAADDGPMPLVVRVADRRRLVSGWSRAEVFALAHASGERTLEPLLLVLEPGGSTGGTPKPDPSVGEKFGFVVEGAASLTVGETVHALEAGDAAYLPAEAPHRWANESDVPTRILIVAARMRR
jgi:transcriptional regulator with XRE-family HTH domain